MASNTSSGGVGNPALFIAIELNGMNGFTGSLAVTHGQEAGALYFAEGQIVHAETGGEIGEDAFRRILAWPTSVYVIHTDAVPARRTLTRDLDVLLGESRGNTPAGAYPRPTRSTEAPAGARPQGLAGIAEQVRKIPGVVGAVLHDADGTITGSAPGGPAEMKALSLTRLGKKLGELLKAGPIVLGVVHGSKRNLLLLTSRDQQLTILIEAGHQADAAQAQIRKLLSAQG